MTRVVEARRPRHYRRGGGAGAHRLPEPSAPRPRGGKHRTTRREIGRYGRLQAAALSRLEQADRRGRLWTSACQLHTLKVARKPTRVMQPSPQPPSRPRRRSNHLPRTSLHHRRRAAPPAHRCARRRWSLSRASTSFDQRATQARRRRHARRERRSRRRYGESLGSALQHPNPPPARPRVDPTASRGSKRWDQGRSPSRLHRCRRRTPRRRGLRPERQRHRRVARCASRQVASCTSDGP